MTEAGDIPSRTALPERLSVRYNFNAARSKYRGTVKFYLFAVRIVFAIFVVL